MHDDVEMRPGDLIRIELADGVVHHAIVTVAEPTEDGMHLELIPDPTEASDAS